MSLNKENFNEGEYCSKNKDVYREILPNAVSTTEGREMKRVANSSSITGLSEADLDFSVLNESQQNEEKMWNEGTKSKK